MILNHAGGQQGVIANAAAKWNISFQTLWGVYGTESGFGQNKNVSSAGAVGPMQFEPSTWAKYGGGADPRSLLSAAPAAAHYLHDLGADTDPKSPGTVAALNAYNGNGGGSDSNTDYVQKVWKNGRTAAGTGSSNTPGSMADPTSTGDTGLTNILGEAIGNPIGGGGVISNLITDAVKTLAPVAGTIVAVMVKDVGVGIYKFAIVPVWHLNQRATDFYWTNVLDPRAKGQFQWGFPWTAAFWGLGYILLFTDPEGKPLKPAPIHRTHLARHIERAQALPARRELVKPKHVKSKTPQKPKEVTSKATVVQTNTLHTTRVRTVKVSGGSNTTEQPNRSEVNVKPEGTLGSQEEGHHKPTRSTRVTNPGDRGGSGSREGSGVTTSGGPTSGSRKRGDT